MSSVEGQSTVRVGTEAELRGAVSNAASNAPVVITLDKEIGLTGGALIIPANKDITIRSNGNVEFELFGASGASTITVENQGILTLAGIVVTHVSGASGEGVYVQSGGKLTLTSGKISGNAGNGVYHSGNFTMTGGMIANNRDCGVYINSAYNSNFTMTGGEISGNRVGVFLESPYAIPHYFNMTGGKISGNTGIGVNNYRGIFTMTGGEVSGNGDGGVTNSGVFIMSNGKISGNTVSSFSYTVDNGGGGVHNTATFTMSGGEISNNTVAERYNDNGGGVWTNGIFTMTGGAISKNSATNGGGVYVSSGIFNLYGGKITGNTAARNGGGCWVTDSVTNFNRLVVSNGVVFSDNRALAAYNRDSQHDSIYRAYIENSVVWSESFTQGYNNFDISYIFGTSITAFSVTINDGYGTPTGAGSYSVGQTVTLNAGTRAGYTFSRWTVNEGSVTLSSTASTTATFTMPTNNVVITASWTVIQYNIRYTLNSGSNAAGNPATYNAGNSFPITIGNPTRANYEFRGWNVTYADGTQVSFQVSYSIPAGTLGNIDLAANWVTASSDNSGGSGGSGSGGSSGSSGGSSGGGGSSGSSDGGGSDNNTPSNGNDGSHGSDDNNQRTIDNDPLSENSNDPITTDVLGIALSVIGVFVIVGLLYFIVNRRKKRSEQVEREQLQWEQRQREEQEAREREWDAAQKRAEEEHKREEEQRRNAEERYRQQEEQELSRCFEILGVPVTASENDVKNAYRAQCKAWAYDKMTPDQKNNPIVNQKFHDTMCDIHKAWAEIKKHKGWQ
ncbi:MAG: InlB B-repeat-containing protein [Nitrososphaerota archaeon]|nr:InlB B-repeat-containing protein [Nitrososphaerota archaeon]